MSSTKSHQTSTRPYQPNAPRLRQTPIAHQRFPRPMNGGIVTSSMGGKLVPLMAMGLHREDSIRSSRLMVNCTMAETAQMLINPVRVTVRAMFVPKMALQRFKDMGSISRSFAGQQEIDGSVIPWFEALASTDIELLRVMGIHGSAGNTDYVESYNQIWNHLATLTSPSLELAQLDNTALLPAFWANTQMKHVKPHFDDALLEGEVALNVVESSLPVRGLGAPGSVTTSATGVKETDGTTRDYAHNYNSSNFIMEAQSSGGFPAVYAEMAQNGITISLANIKLARETAAWSRLRTQYQGYSEEWMMDQMLAGIEVPDEMLRQPIELDRKETVIGMTQRYATDAANLDKSMTDGQTAVMLDLNLPRITTGGTLMVVAQALPEQHYERQRDPYFHAMQVSELPNRTADELDVQPVDLVKKGEVDESHTSPDDLFGYRPLNAKWIGRGAKIGGKYYRPDPTAAWTEDRNRIWTPDVANPELGPDFYLSTNLSHDVFVSNTEDAFEWWQSGIVQLEGLTYFGPALREGIDDYDKVLNQVDQSRLKGDGSDVPTADADNSVVEAE